MKSIDKLRIEIDEVDRELARLFEKRMKIVEGVARYKKSKGMEILDESREVEVIDKNVARIEDETLKPYYEEFQRHMMDVSKSYQKNLLDLGDIVGYQGVEGAFSHIALNRVFKGKRERSYKTFEDLFKAVEEGEVRYGILPIENSYTGEIGEVFDLLKKYSLNIVDTYKLKIEQNLLGLGEVEDIKEVYSHPQGFLQSEKFLLDRGWQEIPHKNTAMSAKHVSDAKSVEKAAIGSEDTAKIYGLKVLARNINTNDNNTTKFVVISRELSLDLDIFSLIFTTDHQKGSLVRVLNIIEKHGYNMSNLKSRPIKDIPWEYYFYVEIEGSLEGAKEMLKEIEDVTHSIKVVGSYSR